MPVPPVIEAGTITLRPVAETDINEKYLNWLLDPEVNRYLETRHHKQTLALIRDFVHAKTDSIDEYLFAISRADVGSHIGNIKIGPINTRHKLAEISLIIGDRSSWGGGFGSRGISGVTRFAFTMLGLNKVAAGLYAPNVGSERAFLKAGWRKEAVLHGHYALDGAPCDLVLMGMWRSLWAQETL